MARSHEPILPPLPPLALQYADFACWSNAASQVEQNSSTSVFRGSSLCCRRPSRAANRSKAAVRAKPSRGQNTFVIAASLTQALRQRARPARVTLFVTLLAGFKLLLARYSGRHDILVDTPVLGRNRSELEPLVGLFVNSRSFAPISRLSHVRRADESRPAHRAAGICQPGSPF